MNCKVTNMVGMVGHLVALPLKSNRYLSTSCFFSLLFDQHELSGLNMRHSAIMTNKNKACNLFYEEGIQLPISLGRLLYFFPFSLFLTPQVFEDGHFLNTDFAADSCMIEDMQCSIDTNKAEVINYEYLYPLHGIKIIGLQISNHYL